LTGSKYYRIFYRLLSKSHLQS